MKERELPVRWREARRENNRVYLQVAKMRPVPFAGVQVAGELYGVESDEELRRVSVRKLALVLIKTCIHAARSAQNAPQSRQ